MRLAGQESRLTRNAFTVIELCMGLVITSLVLGAMAAFTLAMAQHWKQGDQGGSATTRSRLASQSLTRHVTDARHIGAVRKGSVDNPAPAAAVILWVSDTNKDGLIQGAECALIEHDQDGSLLKIYPSGQGDAVTPIVWSVFTDPSVLDNFVIGRTAHPIARGVQRAEFAVRGNLDDAQIPTLEYTLKIDPNSAGAGQPDAQHLNEYGTCTVRAPARLPS